MRSKDSTVCLEKIASELRAVVSNDAIRDPKPAYDTLDELDRGSGRDGADGFYLRLFGELVDGDVEITVAPWRSWERA